MTKRVAATVLVAVGAALMALVWGGCGDDSKSPQGPRLRVTPDAMVREIPYGINPDRKSVV